MLQLVRSDAAFRYHPRKFDVLPVRLFCGALFAILEFQSCHHQLRSLNR